MNPLIALLLGVGGLGLGAGVAYAAKTAKKAAEDSEVNLQHYVRVGDPERKARRKARRAGRFEEETVEGLSELQKLEAELQLLQDGLASGSIPLAYMDDAEEEVEDLEDRIATLRRGGKAVAGLPEAYLLRQGAAPKTAELSIAGLPEATQLRQRRSSAEAVAWRTHELLGRHWQNALRVRQAGRGLWAIDAPATAKRSVKRAAMQAVAELGEPGIRLREARRSPGAIGEGWGLYIDQVRV